MPAVHLTGTPDRQHASSSWLLHHSRLLHWLAQLATHLQVVNADLHTGCRHELHGCCSLPRLKLRHMAAASCRMHTPNFHATQQQPPPTLSTVNHAVLAPSRHTGLCNLSSSVRASSCWGPSGPRDGSACAGGHRPQHPHLHRLGSAEAVPWSPSGESTQQQPAPEHHPPARCMIKAAMTTARFITTAHAGAYVQSERPGPARCLCWIGLLPCG